MPPEPPGLLAAAWIVARKDLAVELRTKSAFLSVLVFALLGLVIFFFAWDPTAVPAMDLAPGVLWVTFTFAGLLGLHRSFGVEMQDRGIDALLVAPVDREAIYLGKALANTIFVTAVLVVAVPAVAVFYNLPFGRSLLALGVVAVLAAIVRRGGQHEVGMSLGRIGFIQCLNMVNPDAFALQPVFI